MKIVIYNNNKIKKILSLVNSDNKIIEELKLKNIISNEDKYKVYEQIKDMNVKDIRAIKDDGSVMSLGEQIKNKIITLEKDEEIRDGHIYKLNRNIEEDFIKLIEKGLEKLDDDKKIETDKNGTKYITVKTYEELFKDNLITAEEYNQYIINQRQSLYSSELDGKRAELLDDVLQTLDNKGLLTEEQKLKLESLKTQRKDIKYKYKKNY